MAEPTFVKNDHEPWDDWLRRRYVVALPEGAPEDQSPRYLKLLGGNFRGLPHEEQVRFVGALVDDAREISHQDLTFLFHLGWRERLTAAWLVGVDRRTRFQHMLRHLLLNEADHHATPGYCYALVALEDAEGLVTYLDHRLIQGDADGDPEYALGALVYLDRLGGTRYAAPFLGYGLEYQYVVDFMEYTERI